MSNINLYITTTKDNHEKFSEYGNPHGIYYCIYTKSFITLSEKEDLTKKVYDIVFNNKKTGTDLDRFVEKYYFDDDHYRELASELSDEFEGFSAFMNDMCFSEANLYNMCGGESEDYIFVGSDGITYITMCRLFNDYSLEAPMLMEIAHTIYD